MNQCLYVGVLQWLAADAVRAGERQSECRRSAIGRRANTALSEHVGIVLQHASIATVLQNMGPATCRAHNSIL